MYISFFCVDFFALGSTRKPNSQWNIGGVGSLALGLCVGHVHFIFFVLISFASDTRRKPVFQWNMGFNIFTKIILNVNISVNIKDTHLICSMTILDMIREGILF